MEYKEFEKINLQYGDLITVLYEHQSGKSGHICRKKDVGFFENIEKPFPESKNYLVHIGRTFNCELAKIIDKSGVSLEYILEIDLISKK